MEARKKRLQKLCRVIEACGFEVAVLGRDVCDEHMVKRVLVQHQGDPWQISYCDRTLRHLDKAREGDVIVATEEWHADIFRGIDFLAWDGAAPVVEAWIDYQNPFTYWRSYSTEYCRAYTCGRQDVCGWTHNYFVTYPFIEEQTVVPSLEVCEIMGWDGIDLPHWKALEFGIPVLAPAWGTYPETLQHGKSGVMYQTPEGRDAARPYAEQLPSALVRKTASEQFPFERSVKELKPFLARAIMDRTRWKGFLKNERTDQTAKHAEPRGPDRLDGSDP